jgi:hypothetical protein
MTGKEIKSYLCYYDLRNPNGVIDYLSNDYGYDDEEIASFGNFPKKGCACDNCYYDRTKLAEELLKHIKE